MSDTTLRRLNWGCGPSGAPGWINSDLLRGPGIQHSGDIRAGLPLETGSIDYVFSSHALQQLPFLDVPAALVELHRVLKPSGVLRLALPDLDRAIEALLHHDRDYFIIPDDDAATPSAKFVAQMTWYGSSLMLFNYEVAEEFLLKSGFCNVVRCEFGVTRSACPGIVELDNRERETLYVEAEKPR